MYILCQGICKISELKSLKEKRTKCHAVYVFINFFVTKLFVKLWKKTPGNKNFLSEKEIKLNAFKELCKTDLKKSQVWSLEIYLAQGTNELYVLHLWLSNLINNLTNFRRQTFSSFNSFFSCCKWIA